MQTIFDERRYLIPFRAALLPHILTDVLVIGSGVAGMRAAIAASRGADVIVACKGEVSQSNTHLAQGGIAAVLDPSRDSFEAHVADTVAAGAGLCDEGFVSRVVRAAPGRLAELGEWGMRFDEPGADGAGGGVAGPGKRVAFGREGGHLVARIVHADGDATGRALGLTLERRLRRCERVRVFAECFVLDLLTTGEQGGGRCVGALTYHSRYGLQVIWAAATVLATGGCGQVYRETTNSPVATGDGIAMAYRAGAELADMAFVQFHPTTLYVAGASRSLVTEAVRGEGAYLIDRDGHRFMPDYDERGELAPRDIVSRSILRQIEKTRSSHVFLDCRHLGRERFAERFPGIYRQLGRFGIDPGSEPIPIQPSAHYMIGGVRADVEGRTSIDGLYACGEAAASGMHGANRLASNSLLEGLVMGEVVGRRCVETCVQQGEQAVPRPGPFKIVSDIRPSDRAELDLADVRSSLRSTMWRHVGIVRDGQHLQDVQQMLNFWGRYVLDKVFDDSAGWEVQNMLLVGSLVARAAVWRGESRGTHYRVDAPEADDRYLGHDVWVKGRGEPDLVRVAVGSEAGEGV